MQFNQSRKNKTNMTNTMVSIKAHGYSWEIIYDAITYDNVREDHILCWALTDKSETVLLRFMDYDTYMYVELPSVTEEGAVISWSDLLARKLYDRLCNSLKARTRRDGKESHDDRPTKMEYNVRKTYYYYQSTPNKHILKLYFKSSSALRHCKNILVDSRTGLSKPFYVKGIGKLGCKIWEDRVSPVKKMLIDTKCRHSQWFDIVAVSPEDEENKIAKIDEYIASWKSIKPISLENSKDLVSHPGILVFDCESYSDRHMAFPKAYMLKHKVFMISCIYEKLGLPETRKRYLITMGKCDPIPDVEIISVGFNEEDKLIEAFMDLCVRLRPNITAGHNIFGFDWPYLDTRRKICNIESWDKLSMLKIKGAKFKPDSWESSGTGKMVMKPVTAPGIINIDTLIIARREFSLRRYTLDSVGNYLLGRGKHDVSAQDMFIAFEEHSKSTKLLDLITCPNGGYHKNIDKSVVEEVLDMYSKSSELWRKVGAYCVEDSELVVDILLKMNAWVGLIESSNIMGLEIYDIYTRGQQTRVYSKILDYTHDRDIIVDYKPPPKGKWAGGHVAAPNPGLHEHVVCLDFKSLYPSLIIELNIGHDTLVMDPSIPDEHCNVIQIMDVKDKDKEIDRYRYIKREIYEGVLPQIERELIGERDAVRKFMEQVTDPRYYVVLNKRQLSLKVTGNSAYGLLGAQEKGMLPLIQASRSITARGRTDILLCNEYLEEKENTPVIYNDTDSTFGIPDVDNYADAVDKGKELGEKLTALFNDPMLMELEKVGRMLCLKAKKKYVFWGVYLKDKLDKEGNIIARKGDFKPESEIKFTGGTMARRDDCMWKKNLCKKLMIMVMKKESFDNVFDSYIVGLYKLLSGKVDPNNLVMTVSKNTTSYKQKTAFMKIFPERMQALGVEIAKGDRVQYIIADVQEQRKGDKAFTADLFFQRRDSKDPKLALHEDVAWYALNSENDIMEVISVAFGSILDVLIEQDKDRVAMEIIEDLIDMGYRFIEEYLGNNTPYTVYEHLIYNGLNDKKLHKDAKKLRTKYITGRSVFNPVIDMHPAKLMVKAYKRDMAARANGEEEIYLRHAIGVLATEECYNTLFP